MLNFRIFFGVKVSQFSSRSLSNLTFSAVEIFAVEGLGEGSSGKGASLTDWIEGRSRPVCGEMNELEAGSSTGEGSGPSAGDLTRGGRFGTSRYAEVESCSSYCRVEDSS